MNKLFHFLIVTFSIASCNKEYESIEALDEKNIQAYIQQNNLNVVQFKNSGVYYEIMEQGSGTPMQYRDSIPLVYTFKSLDGTFSAQDTFATSNRYGARLGHYLSEPMHTIIQEKLVKRGGKIRILFPSRLAYGRNGTATVPANASLEFMIHAVDETKQDEYDDLSTQKYMNANGFLIDNYIKSNTGIYYKINDPGTGSSITVDSTITVEYTGKLFNGTVFDSSIYTFLLSSLISGWKECIPLLHQGGSIHMIIPSKQAYGRKGNTNVPPVSCLDFTVKVTDVSP